MTTSRRRNAFFSCALWDVVNLYKREKDARTLIPSCFFSAMKMMIRTQHFLHHFLFSESEPIIFHSRVSSLVQVTNGPVVPALNTLFWTNEPHECVPSKRDSQLVPSGWSRLFAPWFSKKLRAQSKILISFLDDPTASIFVGIEIRNVTFLLLYDHLFMVDLWFLIQIGERSHIM